MAYNEKREKQVKKIKKQMQFCKELMLRLDIDFANSVDEQNKDKFDAYGEVRNKSRHANDVVRLRRELNILRQMLEESVYEAY